MENPLRKQIRSIMKDHKKRQMWYRIVTTLAVVVVFVTTYMLILPAITMENKAECGITEHKHDANCYSSHYEKEKELACTTDSLGVHKHTDACYDAEHKLICGYADFVIHEHDASCYDKDGNLVCTIPEHKLHQHTPECYQMQKQLVCTQEESVGHTHTPECYTKQQGALICGKEEHTHGEGCYDAEGNLICTLEEHTHSDECYEWNDILTCTIPESAGHTHSEACYQNVQVLVCEEPAELHTHTAECYKDGVLACGKLELKEHKHSETCFTEKQVLVETLICDRVEHVHTDECYQTSEDIEREIDIDIETETETESEGVFETETETEETTSEEAEAETEVETETETEIEIETETETETETEEVSTEVETEEESSEEVSSEAETEPEETVPEETEAEEISTEAETEEEGSEEESSEAETETETESEEEESTEAETEEEKKQIDVDAWDVYADGPLFVAEKVDTEDLVLDDDLTPDNDAQNGIMVMSYRMVARMFLAPSGSAQPEGTDFGSYITSAVVQKIVNGKWQDATEFNNGDQVKVTLQYEIPANIVTPANSSIYYQLPTGVVPNKSLSGIVYSGGVAVGTYTISEEGLIQIEFYDSFATGNAITGDIYFAGTVSSSNTKEDYQISFGSDQNTITIKKEEEEETPTDIDIKKETTSKSAEEIEYRVTISTQKGTGENVYLADYLTNGRYKSDSVSVTKVDGGGAETSVSCTPTINNDVSPRTLNINDLPVLQPGEKYNITYKAVPENRSANGEWKVTNNAGTNKGKWSWNETVVSEPIISKNGTFDENTKQIKWTVTIKPSGLDLNGYTLTDTIDGSEFKGTVTLTWTGENETESSEITLPYTFDGTAHKDGTYTIVYTTDIPTGSESGNVTNNATISKEGESSFTDGKTVGYSKRGWGLSKYKLNETVESDSKVIYTWCSTITLPDEAISEFTYTDTINSSEHVKHFATEADINISGFKVAYVDASGMLHENADIDELYDYNVAYTKDEEGHITGFNIIFTPKEDVTVRGKSIEFTYQTHADVSAVTPGESVSITNTAQVNELSVDASASYKKPKRLMKGYSASGSLVLPDDGWIASGSWFNYETSGGTITIGDENLLYYRLIIRPQNIEDIVIIDQLPDGVSFKEGSGYAVYCSINDYGDTLNGIWKNENGQSLNTAFEVINNESIQNQLKITVSNIQDKACQQGNGIAVYYAVELSDSLIDGVGATTITNTAEWNGNTASTDTTVKKKKQILQKTGSQCKDATTGDWIDALEYSIVINPAAEDLDPDSDTLKLVDELTFSGSNGGELSAYLDLDSIKLYVYNAGAENSRGEEISPTRYQITYDNNQKMTVALPDELACVLVYRYNYDTGGLAAPDGFIPNVSVSNSVSLLGEGSNSTLDKIISNDSGASANQQITVYKIDSKDYSKKLSGAEFNLYYYDDTSKTWAQDGSDLITNLLGEIVFDYNSMKKDTLYKLVEKNAPDGYAISSSDIYFIWKDEKSIEQIWNAMDWNFKQNIGGDSVKNSIQLIGNTGGAIYVPNDCTTVTVKKVWVDTDGTALTNVPESIQVQLYQMTGHVDGYNVTLKYKINGWDQKVVEYFVKPKTSITITTKENWYTNTSIPDFQVELDNGEVFGSTTVDTKSGVAVISTNAIDSDCTIDIKGTAQFHDDPLIKCVEADQIVNESTERYGESVVLNSDNNWSYTWKNLPAKKAEDETQQYYYKVEEVDPPSGYTVIMRNNNGIQSGEIVITNKKDKEEPSYTLPETGGTGTYLYILGGLLLTAGAALLMYTKSVKKGGRRIW